MHLIFIIDINGLAKFITFVTLIADQSGGFCRKMRSRSKKVTACLMALCLSVLSDKARRHLARYIIAPMLSTAIFSNVRISNSGATHFR
ncbi:hypothetical protein GFA32_05805 [Salmonella enterica]|nr:hypothetical protein [Salmonella enterica subsp. enterica serovar Montevideo]